MNIKKTIKYLVVVGTFAALCGWLFGFYLPTKQWYKDLKATKGASITAIELLKQFKVNEATANAQFNEKIFDVTGVVKESKIDNGKTLIWLKTLDNTATVSFVLKDSIALPTAETEITIKGKCSGYLDDGMESNVQFVEGEMIKK
jgi:tRNA_anti-like